MSLKWAKMAYIFALKVFNPIQVGGGWMPPPPKTRFFSYQKTKTRMPRGSPMTITHFGLENFWRKFFSPAAHFWPYFHNISWQKSVYRGGGWHPPLPGWQGSKNGRNLKIGTHLGNDKTKKPWKNQLNRSIWHENIAIFRFYGYWLLNPQGSRTSGVK